VESNSCITTRPALRPPPVGFQPLARRELAVAKIPVNANLSLIEPSHEQVFPAITIDVCPARRIETGTFDPDRRPVRFEADRRLKLCGATNGKHAAHQQC
jgi:hypothetical protein